MSTLTHEFPLNKSANFLRSEPLRKALEDAPDIHIAFQESTDKLILEAPRSYSCDVLQREVQSILHRLDPEVQVGPCRHQAESEKVLTITGLSCADCAEKLGQAIAKLPGVEDANLHFMANKIYVQPDPQIPWPETYDAIVALTRKREPQARIENPDEAVPGPGGQKAIHDHAHSHSAPKLSWGHLFGAVALLLAALFAPIPSQLRVLAYVFAYGLVGWQVLRQAFQSVRHGDIFNEYVLMAIASLGAFAIGEYPEAVAVMLFYSIGEMAQDRAVDASRKSIEALLDIQPDYANLLTSTNEVVQVAPEKVGIGDILLVKAGERVPLDGRILDGHSDLDTSAVTGESALRHVQAGDTILSGSINTRGLLKIEVTKAYEESTVAVILDLVEHAGANKAPTERFITRFARYYTPIVVFAALALAILPPLFIGGGFETWLYRSLVFLVASCPCALVLSVPLTFYAGIGAGSRKGILIKGGQYLENLAKASTIAFDKTGTLTQARFAIDHVSTQGQLSAAAMLEIIARMESASNHPLASAFESYDAQRLPLNDLEEIAGHGLKGTVDGQVVLLGNAKLMTQAGIAYQNPEDTGTAIHLAIEGRYQGHILLSDQIRPEAPASLAALKAKGIESLVMLTGDLSHTAQALSQKLGMDQVYADLLPQDKLSHLIDLERTSSGAVVYVGDGINDAPVLAQADVGIAMGGIGSDAAIEVADIVITTDQLDRLPMAVDLSQQTMRIAKQNIAFALIVKGAVLLLGSVGMASMWAAVFADVGVALLCVLNAMRLLQNVKSENL